MKRFKKIIIPIISLFILFNLASCYEEVSFSTFDQELDSIDGLDISWTRIETLSRDKPSLVKNDNEAYITFYIELTSGSFKPYIKGSIKEEDTLYFVYSYSFDGDIYTCDMAYYLCEIISPLSYVNNINKIGIYFAKYDL